MRRSDRDQVKATKTTTRRSLLIGGAIFAVTLYAMALGAPRWLGAVTPIGGTLLIIGWLWAGWIYLKA